MDGIAASNRGLRGFERAISQSYGSWELDTAVRDADFTWRIREFCIDSLRLNNNTNDAPYSGRRSTRPTTRAADITIMYVMRGSFTMSQGLGPAHCGPGAMILFDNAKPIESEQHEATETISVTIPARNFAGRYTSILECCGTAVRADAGYAYLLKSFLLALWEKKSDFDALEASSVAEILNEMIYPCFRRNLDPWPADCDGGNYLRAARRIVQRDLENPELSPAFVARKLGISVSYLYALFRQARTTVNQLIIDERLDRCRELMASPRWAHRSLTDIAYQTGFRDPSHFSRRFKARFDVTPRRYREGLSKRS